MKQMKTYLLLSLLFLCTGSFAQEDGAIALLKGKKLGVIGDSYVRNHKEPKEYTWHYKFAEKYGMRYLNYGRNGNCIAYSRARFGTGMYERYASMADSLDYVIVVGGHNDTAMLDSIGGIGVFKERMSVLCRGLVDKYPSAKIFFFTRWNCENFGGSQAEEVVDAMIEVCNNYSIPILDCARKSGIYAWNQSFRQLYFQSAGDDAHLNERGHERFLEYAEKFILQY